MTNSEDQAYEDFPTAREILDGPPARDAVERHEMDEDEMAPVPDDGTPHPKPDPEQAWFEPGNGRVWVKSGSKYYLTGWASGISELDTTTLTRLVPEESDAPQPPEATVIAAPWTAQLPPPPVPSARVRAFEVPPRSIQQIFGAQTVKAFALVVDMVAPAELTPTVVASWHAIAAELGARSCIVSTGEILMPGKTMSVKRGGVEVATLATGTN